MAITNPISELEDENGNVLGIAAKGLDTPVQISLTGNVTGGSGNTDLSGNVTIPTTIANGSVTESKIATDAVTNGKVKDGELTKAKLNASAYNEVDGTIADGTNANLATKTQVKAYVESVLSSEGHYKIKQAAKTDPTASGTTITAIDTITQNSNGEITATKKTIRSGTTSQTGIVQLKGSVAASESDDSTAATPKSVRDAINALDVSEVGGTGKYIKAISEADGKISATAETMDTTPTANSQKAITSGGVKAAIAALDAASVGGDGKFISAISETDGIISATAKTMDSVPTANHTDTTVTSAGIKTALDAKQTRGMVDALSDVQLPNAFNDRVWRSVGLAIPDYTPLILLYDVSVFFDTTSGLPNEHSVFTGVITEQRISGSHRNTIANICAGIGYNSAYGSLKTDNITYEPLIVQKNFEEAGEWESGKGYVIGAVGSTVGAAATLPNSRCTMIDCSGQATVFINAGYENTQQYSQVGAVWAFLDSSNKIIQKSSTQLVNASITVPSGAAKLVCNSKNAIRAYAGLAATTPKYYLAIRNRNTSYTSAVLFGRFLTRTAASNGIAARPLLLEIVPGAGQTIGAVPAGWTYVQRSELYVNAATADAAREGSALETAINSKVDKVTGKDLSTNDFTDALKSKLDGIAAGAEVNVQSDWNQTNTNADDYINNKPQNLVQDANYVHTDNNFTSAYKDKVDANTTARHSHSNKTVLDGITAEKVAAWDAKQEAISWMNDTETDALFTAAWDAANA